MKKLLIFSLTVMIAGCASTYKGPQSGSLAYLCRAEGHTMRTFHTCFEEKLEKAQPGWKFKDEDAWAMIHLIDYSKALGERVSEGKLSDKDAFQMYKEENNNLASQKQNRAYQAKIEQQNRSAAAIAAGALILGSQPRPVTYNAAPLPQYPSDTTININTAQPYRFNDSRPYK